MFSVTVDKFESDKQDFLNIHYISFAKTPKK